jgi:putative ABC transport system ATP-binding protein
MLQMIHARQLGKGFFEGGRRRVVLDGLDLEVNHGESIALLGQSGSGKSTLLNLLCGIDVPDTGTIALGNTQLNMLSERARTLFRRRSIGFVFQFFNLLPTLTVIDNVMLPQRLNGISARRARAESLGLLTTVGLADRAEAYPDRLSGGEQQRVAVVRAIAHRPMLILADEPTGNLDSETGRALLDDLFALTKERGATLVMATHADAAAARCDRLVTLRDGVLGGG